MDKKSSYRLDWLALAALFAVASCTEENASSSARAETGNHLSRIEAAIAQTTRPGEDRADDAIRKPTAILAFLDVKPGMSVFEVEAGGGYYTELLSSLVGSDGEVVMQSPPNFDSYLAAPIEHRLNDGRLANVRLSKSAFDQLDAADESTDLAAWLLGPHELFFTPSDGSNFGDPSAAFAEIFRIMKPGGVFIVMDHAAAPGTPPASSGAVHRIDPAWVKQMAAQAGFVLIEESDIMRNPNDDYSMTVFDPVVRRKTDRFLLKYRKP
jgi:predicted methyltransferase